MSTKKDIYVHVKGKWKAKSESSPERVLYFKATTDNPIVSAFTINGNDNIISVHPDFNTKNMHVIRPYMNSINAPKTFNDDYSAYYSGSMFKPVSDFILEHGEFADPAWAILVQEIIKNPFVDHQ